jgi:hypothetical protein
MGLWLKCPGCQAQNPLFMQVCPSCGQDLKHLAATQRVYVIGPAAASSPASKSVKAPATPEPAPAAAAPSQASLPASEAAKTAKKAKKTRKKKS